MGLSTALAFTWILAATASSSADDFSRMCKRDAQAEYKTCQATCKETVQLERDVCTERNHDCAEQCRVEKQDCSAPTLAGVLVCVDLAKDDFEAALAACRENYEVGSAVRDLCIDDAQLLYFFQRDACREEFSLASTLSECKRDFRFCMRQCEPVND